MDESVAHIVSNVFIGSLAGAEDGELLERLGVTNIVTVDTHKPRVSATMTWWVRWDRAGWRIEEIILSTLFYLSFWIEITDEETSDLLSHLDEAVQFIEGCLGEGGGGVLVHCRYVCPVLSLC